MNNEDRELLEMAAKAAGVTAFQTVSPFRSDIPYFDPRISDGDALRLAVKLGLTVDCDRHLEEVTAYRIRSEVDTYITADEYYDPDPYAATRRAITRAAAQIGKQMK